MQNFKKQVHIWLFFPHYIFLPLECREKGGGQKHTRRCSRARTSEMVWLLQQSRTNKPNSHPYVIYPIKIFETSNRNIPRKRPTGQSQVRKSSEECQVGDEHSLLYPTVPHTTVWKTELINTYGNHYTDSEIRDNVNYQNEHHPESL